MTMKRFRLAVLGGFELRRPTGARVRLPTRKAEALLAYLALGPDRPHSREALAALLWADAPERQARGSLRQTLSLAREQKQGYGAGIAERVLGRCALAHGALDEAAARLDGARATFGAIEARFEVGRTLMASADVARARGDDDGATTALKEARQNFEELDVRRYVERVAALTR